MTVTATGSEPRGGWNSAVAHAMLMEWAATVEKFETKTCPSPGTIQKHLNLKDSTHMWEYVRTHLQGRDEDIIEVRIPCLSWGSKPFRQVRVSDWRDGTVRCPCKWCEGATIAEVCPHLVPLMRRPEASTPVTAYIDIYCPNRTPETDALHTRISTTAERFLETPWLCRRCYAATKIYATHNPGDVVKRGRFGPQERRSKREVALAAACRDLFGDEAVDTSGSILLDPEANYFVLAVTPDFLLPGRRVAVEVDGGNGHSPQYSRHDTWEGARDDEVRDRLLKAVGWRVVRVRHPDAIPIDSHSTVVHDTGRSPRRIAEAIAAALEV